MHRAHMFTTSDNVFAELELKKYPYNHGTHTCFFYSQSVHLNWKCASLDILSIVVTVAVYTNTLKLIFQNIE